jgi:hypothetical protein
MRKNTILAIVLVSALAGALTACDDKNNNSNWPAVRLTVCTCLPVLKPCGDGVWPSLVVRLDPHQLLNESCHIEKDWVIRVQRVFLFD